MGRNKIVVLLAFVLAIAMLAGCSGNKGNGGSAGTEAEVRELVYATAKDINDMNPHLYPGSMPAQGIIYESLVENTPEGIKPLLAESWDISEDGKSYTFHLRKDVKFHDGEPFNAEAVKQNIDAVQRNGSKHAWIKLSTKLAEVSAVDEFTVKLTLTETYYPTLLELSMTRPYVFISPKDFLNGETKDGVTGYHGTGPYRLEEHVTEQYASFEANEDYWGGAPAVKKLTAKVLPAGETTLLALQKGEVNFVFTDDRGTDSIDVDAMQRLADTGDYRIVRSEPMNTKMIVANSSQTASPVSEKAVREAIWQSIDRETISRTIFGGTETPADALFSSNVNYADVGLEKREYDPEAAAKLLEEAGWTTASGAEIRSKDGRQLTMKLYYDVNSSSQKTQAELLQSEVLKIGMKLDLVGEESSAIAGRRSSGDYDLLFNQTWGLAYDPQSTITAFASDNAYLHTTSGIPRAEELYAKIEQVMVSTDEETRKGLYKDILTIVHEEAVFIPLTNGSVTIVAPSDLVGISFKQTQFELPFERMSFQ
ncbi:nickel ABC transporter, nickel/metallophore periplasmic binding protein [Paenibacillus agaridevorans]|jgi:nickel transport system substrate-binding protein|uniref:Nickel ABC transporter, nickel/metallophore periplasmic binding protein n=1 Tax=Paenibacillus agaridevorans TaxID=171404 RepID=A0A2R5ERK6_9BACL|nr:nickel ABC transporter substrate-binding protein [Paenibacillus agaridevorans]GBG09197.1 nickel ABC transporter, nickel/metallophore periplasmic binding protein [Paenibacillus agaridevorans]